MFINMTTSSYNETLLLPNGELLTVNILILMFGLLAFGGNALALTIIGKYKSLRQKKPYIHMMGALAVTDGITGIGSIIMAIQRLRVQFLNPTTTKLECIGTTTVAVIGAITSQVLLAWIAADRYRSLKKIILQTASNSIKNAYYSLMVAFFGAVVMCIALYIGVDYWVMPPVCNLPASSTVVFKTTWTIFSWSVAIFVFVTYISTVILLKRRIRETRVLTDRSRRNLMKKEIKANKVVFLLLTIYFLFWVVPNIIHNVTKLAGGSLKVLSRTGPLVGIGSVVSSSLHIFVYTMKIKTFRRYLKKFYTCNSVADSNR